MELNSKKPHINFVSVGGFGLSGGKAILDLLKEVDDFVELGAEFRLIKDHYGLMDLETFLIKARRDNSYSDLAIKDFYWFSNELNRVSGRFTREGMGYSDLIEGFLHKVESYIDKLTKFKFRGNWHLLNYKKPLYLQILRKISIKFGLSDGLEVMNYVINDEAEFNQTTKQFIEDLFIELSYDGKRSVLLHNAIPTINSNQGLNYFDNIKQIVIDRDPRDIFADIISRKVSFFYGIKALQDEDYELFVCDFKQRRKDYHILMRDPRILIIRFESLVYDYDQTVKKIFEFLQINPMHQIKGLYFNPEDSKRNIGLWRKVISEEANKYICENLSKYIHK